jgi:hypothetical protein
MASINDVFNELQTINNTLNQLHADALAEIGAINTVNTSVNTLNATTHAGFGATLNAMNVLAQIEIATAKMVFHLTQQADTMICALEHISQNTCAILTQSTIQTRLQARMGADLAAMRELTELANPAAAVEACKLAKLRAEIEKCCPPEVPPPACTYQPCPAPRPIPLPDLPQIPDPQKPPG